MLTNSRPNLYKLLKEEFQVFDSIIDVGCAGLQDLTDFEYSPFKKLYGIDKCFNTNAFGDYRREKLRDEGLTGDEYMKRSSDLMKSFKERFIIQQINIFEFKWETAVFSFIICNKVLHFYSDTKKFQILNVLYNALQPNGLIYLKINHSENQNNTDMTKMDKIAENTYKNKEVPEDIRYLIDPYKFLEKLQTEYEILQKYTTINDRTLAVVLRK